MSVVQWIRRVDREQWARLIVGVSGAFIGNGVIVAIGVQLFQSAT
jgi:hypothetical protein